MSDAATDQQSEARLKKLSEELRCLVCQNQTLADSNADLAVDLRRQVQTMISAGQSDREIRDFMVARYGDFVLYKPPVQSNTALLWFGPFGLLGAGALIWWLVQRRSRLAAATNHAAQAGPEASHQQRRERARKLLSD